MFFFSVIRIIPVADTICCEGDGGGDDGDCDAAPAATNNVDSNTFSSSYLSSLFS